MLFDSSVRKEMARNFGGTLVMMLTIVLTMMLIRTLGLAAKGSVSPNDVTLLLGYTVIAKSPMLLSLSLFVAGVAALTRMYRESEMVIWLVSGANLMQFIRPALRLSWPVILAVLALVGFVRPWAQSQTATLKERFEQRSDLSRVAAGQFQTSANGQRVFYIDRDNQHTPVGRNVFILTQASAEETVTTARSGRVVTDNGLRYLELEQGQRSVIDGRNGDKLVSRFDQSRVLVGEAPPSANTSPPPSARSTQDLLADRGSAIARGELVWRLGQVLSTFNFVLLSLGLAAGNPRRAGSWNLLLALLTFVVYFNLVNLSQAWVAGEQVSASVMLVGLHGGVLLGAMLLIGWRAGLGSLLSLRIRMPKTAAARP